MDFRLDQLERLSKLRDAGALSHVEFENEKRRLFSDSAQLSKSRFQGFRTVALIAFALSAVSLGIIALTNSQFFDFGISVSPSSGQQKRPAQPVLSAPAPQASVPSAMPTKTPDPVPNPWLGVFEGKFEGGADGSLRIQESKNGRLAISIGIGSPRCAGGIDGSVPMTSSRTLVLKKPKDDSGNACRVTLIRRGKVISIEEDGCISYHGFECSLTGVVER